MSFQNAPRLLVGWPLCRRCDGLRCIDPSCCRGAKRHGNSTACMQLSYLCTTCIHVVRSCWPRCIGAKSAARDSAPAPYGCVSLLSVCLSSWLFLCSGGPVRPATSSAAFGRQLPACGSSLPGRRGAASAAWVHVAAYRRGATLVLCAALVGDSKAKVMRAPCASSCVSRLDLSHASRLAPRMQCNK